jgi:hypothetical protein
MQSREATKALIELCIYPSKNEQHKKEKLCEVKKLLEAKADPNATIVYDNNYGKKRSLLTQAIDYHESEIALALIEAKADPNEAFSIHFYPLEHAIIDEDYSSNSKNRSQLDVALALIEAKADPNATFTSGEHPINQILLLMHGQIQDGRNQKEMVEENLVLSALINAKADVKNIVNYNKKEEQIIDLALKSVSSKAKLEALTYASHKRLGKDSPAHSFFKGPLAERNLLRIIGSFLPPDSEYKKKEDEENTKKNKTNKRKWGLP